MRGIDLEINAANGDYKPLELLKFMEIDEFIWQLKEEDITYIRRGKDKIPLTKEFYTGKELKDCILDNDYSIIHLTLRAYPPGSRFNDFVTYQDFLMNDCVMTFICYDKWNVDIRSKDKVYIQKVYEYCSKNSIFQSVEIITDENDYRYKLKVY